MGNPTTIHIRRLADFGPDFPDWLDEQFAAAQNLFSTQAGLDLQMGTNKALHRDAGIVHATQCLLQGGGTLAQQDLFDSVADIPASDIVVFIVHGFSPWQGGGCAWHPPGLLGCMVTFGTLGLAQWKLAHELGHVLGLFHQPDRSKMLMYPSVAWDREPPLLALAEINFLKGIGPAPVARGEESLALSEKAVRWELGKIEPDYRKLIKYGAKGEPLLRRYYERVQDDEYRARAVYALSLVSREYDDILNQAAASSAAVTRRAAADAAGSLLPRASARRLLLHLLRDPDPTVRFVAAKYVPIPARGSGVRAIRVRGDVRNPVASETPCERGGPEIGATVVNLGSGDTAVFNYLMCRSTAKVQVYLVLHEVQRQLLADEPGKDRISITLPKLPPGRHLLYWGFQRAGFDWQTRAELLVNGICRFRHRKSSDGNDPVNRGFIVLDVIAQHRMKVGHKRKR